MIPELNLQEWLGMLTRLALVAASKAAGRRQLGGLAKDASTEHKIQAGPPLPPLEATLQEPVLRPLLLLVGGWVGVQAMARFLGLEHPQLVKRFLRDPGRPINLERRGEGRRAGGGREAQGRMGEAQEEGGGGEEEGPGVHVPLTAFPLSRPQERALEGLELRSALKAWEQYFWCLPKVSSSSRLLEGGRDVGRGGGGADGWTGDGGDSTTGCPSTAPSWTSAACSWTDGTWPGCG